MPSVRITIHDDKEDYKFRIYYFFDGWGDFRIKYIIGASQEKTSICGALFEFAYLSLNPHFFEDL